MSHICNLSVCYYAPGVQDLNMAYQYSTGNLLHRWDKQKLRKEVFTYDGLDRLASAQVHTVNASGGIVQANPAISYTYDGTVGGTTKGNLATRTDIGKFGTNGYHRITRASGANFPFPYNDPPLAITPGLQNITYTSYHQPASISETVNSTPYLLEYTYDADQQRNYSKLRNMNSPGTPVEERWYEHGLETVRQGGSTSNTYKTLYVEGGDGLCAIVVVGPGNSYTPYAVYKDHLGSLVTVTKKNGSNAQIYVEQNFDAWGRHRSPATWAYAEPVLPPWLFRGYTGHESVWPFTLINMNGRMYDPLNGRMLSADNYVQGGLGTQGYNRYSYAGNNPMKYTDPDGENPLLIAALNGGTLNWLTHGAEFSWDGLKYFGVGAAAGALGAGVGGGLSSALAHGSFWAGAVGTSSVSAVGFGAGALAGAGGGFAGGFASGFGNSLVKGDNFNRSAVNGLNDGLIGGATGGILGGIAGGMKAQEGGGSFWGRGKVTTTTVSRNVPSLSQPPGSQDCIPYAGSAMDRSLGGSLSPADIRAMIGKEGAVDNLVFGSKYAEASGRLFGIKGNGLLYDGAEVFREFSNGSAVMFAQSNGANEVMHALTLQSATRSAYVFNSGLRNAIYQFRVMNPAGGVFQQYLLNPLRDHLMYWSLP